MMHRTSCCLKKHQINKMTYKGACIALALSLIMQPGYAATTSGIDTPNVTTPLPLAVGGIMGLELGQNTTNPALPPNTIVYGNIGIGSTSPAVGYPGQSLDVNGYVKIDSVNGEGGTIQLLGNNGVNIWLENINGVFRLINSPWSADIFHVDQSGNTVAAGSVQTNSVSAAAAVGTGCSPKGAMSYDYAGNQPVYCNGTTWSVMGGGGAPSLVIGEVRINNGGTAPAGVSLGRWRICDLGAAGQYGNSDYEVNRHGDFGDGTYLYYVHSSNAINLVGVRCWRYSTDNSNAAAAYTAMGNQF